MEITENKKKEKKSRKLSRINIEQNYEKVQSNVPALFWVCFSAFLVMIVFCCGVFFAKVKGPEKVLVPNVTGMQIEDALIEMQVNRLYANITLRFSEDGIPKGTVMEQNPKADSLVKANRYIDLVISRGPEKEVVQDVVGKLYDQVQSTENIIKAEPQYIINSKPAGTILAQFPRSGYKVSSPVQLMTVVSYGPEAEKAKVPDVTGMTVTDLLEEMKKSNVIFNVSAHFANENEEFGKVITQTVKPETIVDKYSRVDVELALPEELQENNRFGIFSKTLEEYPFPVDMKLVFRASDGTETELLSFNHPGGNLTVPYVLPQGATILLFVHDSIVEKEIVG
ncbi:MAG: PASTA domain-containing protein [Treponema sp.]|nr:PASTA domain-containing protein [Treponema sp.]